VLARTGLVPPFAATSATPEQKRNPLGSLGEHEGPRQDHWSDGAASASVGLFGGDSTLSRSPIAACLAVLVIVQSACGAGWRQPPAFPTSSPPPRQQAQVFTGGRVLQLHAIHVSADTLSGVPFLRPIGCDSCRIRIARTEIGSLRFGDPTAGLWSTVSLVVAVPALAIGILCLTRHVCPGMD